MTGEFELIARYFAPLAARPGALGLQDDAAVIDPTPGSQIVATADAMVAGVHFLPSDPPGLVGRKLLRVNLSDLAAMGASPIGYLMTVALPSEIDEPWVARFAEGLALDQTEFGIGLLGGDTTRTSGPLCLSLTALGEVAEGHALRRATASSGELIWLSGTLGDGALGLAAAQGENWGLSSVECGEIIDRYRLPRPRVRLGVGLADAGLASAAIDVSDGLVADLGHVCMASGLGAVLTFEDLPLSSVARKALEAEPTLRETILTGGDDYELLFVTRPGEEAAIKALAEEAETEVGVIGRMTDGQGVLVLDRSGTEIAVDRPGWTHM